MSESLYIKDGNGTLKSLQVNSSSYGYISNHSIVSTVTTSSNTLYYTNGPSGWNWDDNKTPTVAQFAETRKSIVIQNNSDIGKCYILMSAAGGTFGEITDNTAPPSSYSIMLDSGATYFADPSTSALKHMIFVPSSSAIATSASMTVAVTEVY